MCASSRPSIDVEVVYAESRRAIARSYRMERPAVLADALRLAAADPAFAGIDVLQAAAGIFGKIAPAGQVLNNGDRVELYRPLAADPKLARRARVCAARKQPGPRRPC